MTELISAPPATSMRTRSAGDFALPLFLPVYQPRSQVFQLASSEWADKIEGIIVNAYFLYKQRDLRLRLGADASLKEFVGFQGLVATDSGAFQGLTRQLYLSNKDIVLFQDAIGADIIAPLDLITPPGDTRTIAENKVHVTEKRVAESLVLAQRATVAAVQQGGRFLELRHATTCRLVELGIEYLAIGSLVPFFTKNHDIGFAASVLLDARRTAGPTIPIHVYGAGDPCEIPFMFACGATIFDSSSYAHYAKDGWYMTPYGALHDPGPVQAGEFSCECPICGLHPIATVFADPDLLSRHNLWTICATVTRLRGLTPPAVLRYLEDLLDIHRRWFPDSLLSTSWQRVLDGTTKC